MRWRIAVRLIDTSGFPAAGVQIQVVYLPGTAQVTVEEPPRTDVNGETVFFIEASEEVCVTIEVHAGSLVLFEKPLVCFRSD
jgi:hypothetical protein